LDQDELLAFAQHWVVTVVQRRRRRLESDATRGSVRRPSGTGCVRGAVGRGIVIRTAALWIIAAAILGGCPKNEDSAAVGEVKEAVTEKKCPETGVPSAGGGDRSIGAEAPSDGCYDYVLELTGSQSGSSLESALNALGAGSVLVRPAAGQSATITDGMTIPRSDVTLYGLNLKGVFRFADGTVMWGVKAEPAMFYADDADGWRIRESLWSGGAGSGTPQGCVGNAFGQNFIINGSQNWIIENSTLKNYVPSQERCTTQHTEALWIGSAKNGTIRNNRFINNGNTAHIFFTWNGLNVRANHPNDICVEGNTFQDVVNCCYDIQTRAELSSSLNISIDPAQVPQKAFLVHPNWLRRCP